MKKTLFAFFCFLHLFADYSIVFVHIGNNIPSHTKIAIEQARLLNPDARIILLANGISLSLFPHFDELANIELINYENIKITPQHELYQKQCSQNSPFWRYTSERFLYLWDLIDAYSLENVFHLENDNMLYANLNFLLPTFQDKYPGIGATFDNDDRCIAGFIWISGKNSMLPLAQYFATLANCGLNDMQVIARYRNISLKVEIDNLPIIMKEYAEDQPMKSPHNHSTNRKDSYFNNSDEFESIFDAAAIGQYLGGIDQIHNNNGPGFINESCLFNPSLLSYSWKKDYNGRLIPCATFKTKEYRIIYLHIHSKRLHEFKS